jgi:hypothetical protein
MDAINPDAREMHQRLKVVRLDEDFCFEQAHLACLLIGNLIPRDGASLVRG